jgi:ribosomal-protein-alanine N-acetyltransferase
MFQEEYSTHRLILRRITEKNLKMFVPSVSKLYCDDEIIKYSGFSTIHSEEEAVTLLKKYTSRPDFYIWALLLKEDQQYIGDISLTVDSYHQFASIGCFLSQNFWGKGYMTEAMKELLFYAFASEGLHRIEAQIHQHNSRSIRFFDKFGFRYEATLRQNFLVNGTFYDTKVYGLLFDEYMNRHGKI